MRAGAGSGRGFSGGADIADLVRYAERQIAPQRDSG